MSHRRCRAARTVIAAIFGVQPSGPAVAQSTPPMFDCRVEGEKIRETLKRNGPFEVRGLFEAWLPSSASQSPPTKTETSLKRLVPAESNLSTMGATFVDGRPNFEFILIANRAWLRRDSGAWSTITEHEATTHLMNPRTGVVGMLNTFTLGGNPGTCVPPSAATNGLASHTVGPFTMQTGPLTVTIKMTLTWDPQIGRMTRYVFEGDTITAGGVERQQRTEEFTYDPAITIEPPALQPQ